jgi:hypothetical protein
VNEQRTRLDGVSLVCVETRRSRLAVMAMQRCMRRIDFRECLLLGAGPGPADLPEPIRHVTIPQLESVAGYSRFMIRELGDYFAGSHVLIVQWDGFVVHPECWDPAFLEYDYIGAPWHHLGGTVGNGGFSLRSRRLMEVMREMDIPEAHPEDYQICVRHRGELESRFHIRFAPREVADRFSWEWREPATPTFGLHGFFNFHRAMEEEELISYLDLCDDDMLRTVQARYLLKHLYLAGKTKAARKLKMRRMGGPLPMRWDATKLQASATLRRWLRTHGRGHAVG